MRTPQEALNDGEILAGIFSRLRHMYQAEGGALPEQVLNMTWNYQTPDNPAPEEVAMESNGKALQDVVDPATGTVLVKKANKSVHSLNCVMMALLQVAAGSSPVPGRQMATRWHAVITLTRLVWVTR